MKHKALNVISAEHDAFWAVLTTLLALNEPGRAPPADFKPLRAMLLYIDEFPEKLHHVKETEVLFPRLRQRAPAAVEVIDRLDQEHARGEQAIRSLQHALLAYELLGESRRAAFVDALERYAKFYFEHMRTEEREVLPLAEQVLTDEDWREIDAAFGTNRDPLTGHAPDKDYEELFRLIATITPAPYGLGLPEA
jgi:hemerythrin-like domain-containing protein